MSDPRQEKIALLTSLAKRRGFIYQSSEIYGGLRGCWDYGPLGAQLKKNVKNAWWRSVVTKHGNVYGHDSSIIMHPKVWEASGHLSGFSDPLVECLLSGNRFRQDQLEAENGTVFEYCGAKSTVSEKQSNDSYKVLARNKGEYDKAKKTARDFYSTKRGIEKPELLGEKSYEIKDSVGEFNPENGGQLSEARNFNLMLKTFLGPAEDSAATVYLRPETAQGIFVNFDNVRQAVRAKIPFGIAQIGKSFRNEITPKNFTFRTREFEQMELEFFCKPGTDDEWHEKWKNERMKWYMDYGIKKENLRFYEHPKEKLAHYAKSCSDIEYLFPFKAQPEWGELEGIANRTDFDLKTHGEFSGKVLSYFDEETKEHYVPYVIEPSAGGDRAALAFLLDAFTEEGEGDEKRTLLKLHPCLAPVKVAVLPLVKKEGMPEIAEKLYAEFLEEDIDAQTDINASIGKRYARQDEIGTPWCITIDGDTVESETVTVRDRDSKEQEKVAIGEAVNYISQKLRKSRP